MKGIMQIQAGLPMRGRKQLLGYVQERVNRFYLLIFISAEYRRVAPAYWGNGNTYLLMKGVREAGIVVRDWEVQYPNESFVAWTGKVQQILVLLETPREYGYKAQGILREYAKEQPHRIYDNLSAALQKIGVTSKVAAKIAERKMAEKKRGKWDPGDDPRQIRMYFYEESERSPGGKPTG